MTSVPYLGRKRGEVFTKMRRPEPFALYSCVITTVAISFFFITLSFTEMVVWANYDILTMSLLLVGLILSQIPRIQIISDTRNRSLLPVSSTWVLALVITTPLFLTQTAIIIAAIVREARHRRRFHLMAPTVSRELLSALAAYLVFGLISTGDIFKMHPEKFDERALLASFMAAGIYYVINVALTQLALGLIKVKPRVLYYTDSGIHSRMALVLVASGPLVAMSSISTPYASLMGIIPLASVWYCASHINRSREQAEQSETDAVRSREEALRDELTGIGNRAAFWHKCDVAIANAQSTGGQVAVYMLDIDHFKQINDNLGHDAGDIVIKNIAARLSVQLSSDVQAFRLGGDEFTLLVETVRSPEQLSDISSQVLELVSTPIEDASIVGDIFTRPIRLVVSTSVGVALYPDHADDSHRLLKHADVAMYRAKEDRNTVHFFNFEEDSPDSHGLELLSDMHESVSKGIFSLFYQPKVDACSGQVLGIEALMRWTHPEHGPVSPEEFIPMAENSGLIVPLTEMMLNDAMFDLRELNSMGHQLDLSVNISARMVANRNIAAWLDSTLNMSQSSASHLILEITEGTLVRDADRAMAVLKGLRERGARISIDDYGTGFSSLSRLVDLSPDELKIDKSFVLHLDEGPNRTIVRSTIQLCNSLGIKVVAEGIENEDVATELRNMGCDVFQGYHYARPMSFDALIDWLEEHNAPWREPAQPVVLLSEIDGAA